MVAAERYKTDLDLRRAVSEDLPYGRSPVKVECPYHPDTVESLAVYPDGVHCFACGANKPPLQFLKDWFDLPDWKAARDKAEALAALPPAPARQAHRPDPTALAGIVSVWCDGLLEQPYRMRYFRRRGFDLATIRAARLGHTGRAYVIPLYDRAGTLFSVKYRRDDELDPDGLRYWTHPGYGATGLYFPPVFDWAKTAIRPLVMAEGELDALLLAQHGVPAVSVNTGVNTVPAVLPQLRDTCSGVVLCLDQDRAGREVAQHAASELTFAGVPVVDVTWDAAHGKDVGEAFVGGYGRQLLAELRRAYSAVLKGATQC